MPISLVLHVLPYDLARGAQVYARALCDALDTPEVNHRILSLFAAPTGVLAPDHRLDVPQAPWRRMGFDPRVSLRLARLLDELRPDVIVTHGSEPLKYVVPLRGTTPLIHYRIGISAVTDGPRLKLLSALHQGADVIAGVSEECLEEARDLFGIDASRTVLLVNGRDPDVYVPGQVRSPPQLLFLGHFAPTKRPGVFLDVVERLRARGVRFDARMIGDGDLLDAAFRARAAACQVELLGRRTDVPALLPAASVFLFTSVPEGEGMPGVFIEAGLCGVPTVATAVPGASTVIQHGETGFVHPHDDLEALTTSAERLLLDPQLAHTLGQAARRRCVEHFSAAGGFARWASLIEHALP